MSAQNGSLVLIKVGDGATPENFATIGGLQLSKLTLNNQPLNATNVTSGPWRELLGASGIGYMAISGSGRFTGSAAEETLRGYAFGGSINNYQFIFAGGDIVSGPFQIADYERGGNYGSQETYSLTLQSGGAITFTPA